MANGQFQVLYSDIGGVLGTNGWDTAIRHDVCSKFGLAIDEMDKRHQLMFDSYERGFLTLDQYLQWVFFAAPRPFNLDQLRETIYAASVPWPKNIELFQTVKRANALKFGLISNEGQGITQYRMDTFGLRAVADFMVVSHYVHLRKPDREIWQLALDLAQVKPSDCVYVDDRAMFVDVAASLGFTAFQHVDLETTRNRFQKLGLKTE